MGKTNNGPWLTIWCCDTKSAREICREGWKLSSALAVGAPLKCAVLFPEDGLLILVTGAAADARIDNTARGHPVSALHWVQKREANLNLNLLPLSLPPSSPSRSAFSRTANLSVPLAAFPREE